MREIQGQHYTFPGAGARAVPIDLAERIPLCEPVSIAIDGPVASGKTAVGRKVAQMLAFRFVDSGAMYRAVTWAALRRGIGLRDQEALARLAKGLSIRLVSATGGERLLVDGEDATEYLRDADVERGVSLVAKVPGVREELVELQRALGEGGGTVMVGRDIGTVVLPCAAAKFFLDAPPEVRARRRCLELRGSGAPADYQQVLGELIRRDKIDSRRADSPLRPAESAVLIDTNDLTIDELAEKILEVVQRS